MPPIAGLFAGTFASVGLGAYLTGTFVFKKVLLASAVITGLSYAIMKLNRRRPGGSVEPPLRDRNVSAQQPNPPRKVVYGKAKFAPAVVASFSNDDYACLVCAVADHKLSRLSRVFLNEEEFLTESEMNSLRTNGYLTVSSSSASDNLSQFRKDVNDRTRERHNDSNSDFMYITYSFEAPEEEGNLGTKLETYDAANSGSRYTPFLTKGARTPKSLAMRMDGVSWITFSFRRSTTNQHYFNNLPSVQVEVERNNDTLKLWDGFAAEEAAKEASVRFQDGNAALAVYDYLKRYTLYGTAACGVPRLDTASAKVAAEHCRVGDFQANGLSHLTTSPASVLEQLAFAMNAGVIAEKAGVRHIHAGVSPDADDVTIHLDTDDIVDNSWAFVPTSPIANRVQTLEVRFMDEDGIEETSGVRAETNRISNTDTIELDFINNQNRAEQLARIMMDRMWNGATFTCNLLNLEKLPEPNDVITATIPELGLNKQTWFRVISVGLEKNRTAAVECIFERPNLFEDQNTGNYVVPVRPSITLPGAAEDVYVVGDAEDPLVVWEESAGDIPATGADRGKVSDPAVQPSELYGVQVSE